MSHFVGDLVQVSKVPRDFKETFSFSRIGIGANTFDSSTFKRVGNVSFRDPEKGEFDNAGDSKRGRPVS